MRAALWLTVLLSAAWAQAQTTAVVDIDTTKTTPLNPNFSGFNDEVVFPPEYYDYRLANLAAQLNPRWVRYPSGLFSQAFDWQTGMMVPAWVAQFSGTNQATLLTQSIAWVNGKGGGSFVDAANRANFLGAQLIVAVNGYTDAAQSAGQMAAYAKANNIHVAVWELCNEPYLYKGFFPSATDYLTKMRPYRDAIKAADPNAVVAVFADDAGDATANPPWNQALAAFPTRYWDAVTYHHYPPQSTGPFSRWMADENAVLAGKANTYVTGYLSTLLPNTKFLISEFLPSNDGLGSGSSITDGTLYGAIYAAEYAMRMSSVPNMLYVGMHAMTGSRGVDAANSHYTDVQNAYAQGKPIDTLALNFGYFTEAQPLGLAVLNGVLRNATTVYATTVTGGPTVAATGLGQIPALYAQAYSSATGQQSLVISNKGATAQTVTVRVNGTAVFLPLSTVFITGTDPTAVNTATAAAVAVQTGTATNPVSVPAYSVFRIDLNPPPFVQAVSSASYAPGPVAPQEIVALFGSNISLETLTGDLPLPVSLGGITVQITDSSGASQLAPLFSVSPTQANILMPGVLAPGPAKLSIVQPTLQGPLTKLTASLTIANSAPGLYSMNSDGAGVAAAIAIRGTATNQSIAETVFTCNSQAARSCLGVPLSLGAATDTLYVELFGTGIRNASSVHVFVGGQSVPVQYYGQAPGFSGLDQVNVTIPQTLAGAGNVSVYLVTDGIASNAVGLTF